METILSAINDNHRVWVYQSTRKFSSDEEALILKSGTDFIAGWATHGKKLYATVLVLHGHFVVIALDELQAAASGCSIDKSVQWIRNIGQELQMDLLDRQNIAWLDENRVIRIATPDEFEALAANQQVGEDVMVFNNLVFNGKDLKHNWMIPARESWHSRFFSFV